MSQDPLHFRWQDLPTDVPMPMLTRQRVMGEQMMISRVHLQRNCFVPRHSHANEQMAFVASGCLKFTIGPDTASREVLVAAGEVLHLPAHLPHAAEALEDTVVYDVFSPPSQATGIDRPTGN